MSIGMMYIPVGGLPSWYMHGVSGIKAHFGITGSALSCCLCWWGVDGRLRGGVDRSGVHRGGDGTPWSVVGAPPLS